MVGQSVWGYGILPDRKTMSGSFFSVLLFYFYTYLPLSPIILLNSPSYLTREQKVADTIRLFT